MENLYIVHLFAIIFAIIGVYFVIRILHKWNSVNIEVLKARIFLDKTFLKKNLIDVTFASIFLVPYQIAELLKHVELISEYHIIYEISQILELLSIIFLVSLLYEWFVILSNENIY